MFKVALVQHTPVFLENEQTLQLGMALISEAAANGAKLIVFTETFIPGYPTWIWRLRPGADTKILAQLHARLFAQSLSIDGDEINALRLAAAANAITIVCGIVERDQLGSRTSLYNSVVVIGEDGVILNKHRKLVPTNAERTVFGHGDASGLLAVETPIGRLGTLICWESYMPLSRYALYAQGIDLYIAPSYDFGNAWIGTLQHIARESGCWVLGCGMAFQARDLPADLPDIAKMYPDPNEWVNDGDSVVVGPTGTLLVGPMRREKGMFYATIDLAENAAARRSLDVAGHSSRPDIFDLHVNCAPMVPITLKFE